MQALKDFFRRFSDERWAIGFITNSLDDILSGKDVNVDWVHDRRRDRWFADPFVLSADEQEIVLLCEEMYKPRGIKIGRISRVTVDRATMTITHVQCLLELPTHLSFPAWHRQGDDIFVYPENSEAGHLTLYCYDDKQRAMQPVGTICDDPVADAIQTNLLGGERMMMATRLPDVNGNELLIYRWDETVEKFTLQQSVSFKENVARMAGDFFNHNGKVYRPTQECNVQYGHAVTLQEVTRDVNGDLAFQEVRRIYSTHPSLTVGCHTFNVFNNGELIATDALGFDRMWFRKMLKFLHLH